MIFNYCLIFQGLESDNIVDQILPHANLQGRGILKARGRGPKNNSISLHKILVTREGNL